MPLLRNYKIELIIRECYVNLLKLVMARIYHFVFRVDRLSLKSLVKCKFQLIIEIWILHLKHFKNSSHNNIKQLIRNINCIVIKVFSKSAFSLKSVFVQWAAEDSRTEVYYAELTHKVLTLLELDANQNRQHGTCATTNAIDIYFLE